MPVVGIEHVQLAMPPGEEHAARAFYSGVLGIPEVPKPPTLAKRGGAWFENEVVKIHLGVERDFRSARKAHPALLVTDLVGLIEWLKVHDTDIIDDEPLENYRRIYVSDPFGNRYMSQTPLVTALS
ncbi:MAG: glyoxalase [Leptolyngbyaceae cyanobacterium]